MVSSGRKKQRKNDDGEYNYIQLAFNLRSQKEILLFKEVDLPRDDTAMPPLPTPAVLECDTPTIIEARV